MKGHIRERSPGRWAIILDVRDPATGKRRRRWHSFAGNKRQAQVEAARLISELQDGAAVDPSRMTVAAFLGQWLEHIKPQVAPRTHERYAEIVRAYLVPALGGVMLSKLQPMAITHQRPPEGRRWALAALGASYSPGLKASPDPSRALAVAIPQPGRPCRSAAG